MSPFDRLPSETILRIVELVSFNDPPPSERNHRYHPNFNQPLNIDHGTVFNLLFLKKFKPAAETVLNETITLKYSYDPTEWVITKRLMKRILDSKDHLSSHIRELIIDDWVHQVIHLQESDVYMEEIIKSVKNLQVLRMTRYWWDEESLGRFLDQFSRLRELEIDVAMDSDDDKRLAPSLKTLTKLSNLRSLSTTITLPSPQYRKGRMNISTYRTAATHLFRKFFEHNPKSRLQTLKFSVWRWDPIPIQDYEPHSVILGMRRLEGENVTSPSDGGYVVEVIGGEGREDRNDFPTINSISTQQEQSTVTYGMGEDSDEEIEGIDSFLGIQG